MSNRDGICCRKCPLQAKLAVFTVCACLSVEETDGKTPSSRGHVLQEGQLLILLFVSSQRAGES